jgi:hypothetical protein
MNALHCFTRGCRQNWLFGAMCLLITFGAQGLQAQNPQLNLSLLDHLAAKAVKVNTVNLPGPTLQMARSYVHGPARHYMRSLKGVYVRDYEFSKPGEYSRADLEGVLKQFRSGGWHAIVTSENKQTGEISDVYVMSEGGETIGMAVIDAKPTKLSIVNLVGSIDLNRLPGLGNNSSNQPPKLQQRPQ